MSTELATQQEVLTPEIMEAVIVGGDLAKLTTRQRLSWYNARCEAAGLDPRTQPFIYLYLNNKLQLYATKTASDAMINKHRLTVEIVERRYDPDLGIYEVRSRVVRPDNGGTVEDIGVMFIAGLKGEALCNALMKAVTKSKRRTVLSACGLGMPDESEAEHDTGAAVSVPAPRQLTSAAQPNPPTAIEVEIPGQTTPGVDSRAYPEIVKAGVEATNTDIFGLAREHGGELPPGVVEIPIVEAHRHMVNWAIQNGLHTGQHPPTVGKAAELMARLYKQNRDVIRVTLRDFLNGKFNEMEAIAENFQEAKETPKRPEPGIPQAPAPDPTPTPAPVHDEPRQDPPDAEEPPAPPQPTRRGGRQQQTPVQPQQPLPMREAGDEGPDD